MIDLSDLDSWQPAKAGGLDLSDLDSFKPKSATLRANASGSAGVEAPKSAWIDETMGQYTRDRAGIDRLHEEAKAAGVPLGRAVKWKRNQLERQDREGVLQAPTTVPLSLGDANESSVNERAAIIRAAEQIQSSPLATWPNTGSKTSIPGEGDDAELTSALDVLENYRKRVSPEVPGPQFMRQMFPRGTAQEVATDPDGSWGAAGESMLQGVRQSVAGGAQALGEKLRYAGNYAPAVRGLLDAPANALRTEGYEQGAASLDRMGELGAGLAQRPTGSVYDDPDGWARYLGQQGVAGSGPTLVGMGAGLVNPVLGAATFMGSAAGSEYGRARIEDNATPSEAGVRAITAAATEGIPEAIGGAAMLGRLPLMKLAQSTARGRAAIAMPVEAGTEALTEKANIELERARGKYISPEEESRRIQDAAVIGGVMGGTIGAGTAVAEGGTSGLLNIRETIRQANSAADISSPMAAAFTRAAQEKTARILGPTATPDAAAGAQIADDAFRAAGVGTVAAADMAEQDALARDLDAATRDQLGSEAEIDRLLTGNAPRAPIPGAIPQGVRVTSDQDGFAAPGAIGGRDAPAPLQVTTLADRSVFVPGDPVAIRQKLADAGSQWQGMAQERDGIVGVRFSPTSWADVQGVVGGNRNEQGGITSAQVLNAADMPTAGWRNSQELVDANGRAGGSVGAGGQYVSPIRVGNDDGRLAVQPEVAGSESFAGVTQPTQAAVAVDGQIGSSINGRSVAPRASDSAVQGAYDGRDSATFRPGDGLGSGGTPQGDGVSQAPASGPVQSVSPALRDLTDDERNFWPALTSEIRASIDNPGGRLIRNADGSVGRTKWADLGPMSGFWRERPAHWNSDDVLAALDRAQTGEKLSVKQRNIVDYAKGWVRQYSADNNADLLAHEQDSKAAQRESMRDDIESTLASVADTSPQQRSSTQSLGGDYTAKLLQYKKDRRAWGLNPQQEQEYQDLLELDRETGKVGGRPMVGVRNKTAYVDALDAGELLPVQGFTDADDFKTLNDKLGHAAGDDAIREIGEVLVAEFGEGNVFHRSGDEFLFQGTDQSDVDAKMQRVRDRLSQITLRATDASGNVQEQRGIGLSYGTGTDEASADAALVADKQRRKESGQRVGQRRTSDRRGVGEGPAGERVRAGEGRSDPAAEGVGDARQVGNTDSLAEGATGGNNGRVSGRAPAGSVQPVVQAGRGTVQSIRAAISAALGPKFLARLDNQKKWFQIVDTVADLPPDVRKSITGGGIAGFVLGNRVYVVAEDAAGNPVGVLLHELGVHYGMAGILGEDFAPTLAKFKRLRAKDDRVGRAYERATEAADKDANGELTEAAKATLDEEALAYFVEQNWNEPDTRGIVAKVIDAIKRLLNRLGMPLSMVNASPELLREVAIGAARMAADGRISVSKDGTLRYMFAGRNAKTANIGTLEQAQAMIAERYDPDVVRQKTGWHQGADGKWRFEIDDSGAKFIATRVPPERLREINQKSWNHGNKDGWMTEREFLREYPTKPEAKAILLRMNMETDRINWNTPTLGDVLDHPELYAAYPGIRGIRVAINNKLAIGRGAYAAADNAIVLSPMDDKDTLSVLLHEIQHGIQEIEGFAKGGSPLDARNVSAIDLMREENARFQKMQEEKEASPEYKEFVRDFIANLPESERSIKSRRGDSMIDVSERLAESAAREKFIAPIEDARRAALDAISKEDKNGGDIGGMIGYRRLAGEVEARNVQARQNLMGDETRRAISPQSTQDVPDERQVVRYSRKADGGSVGGVNRKIPDGFEQMPEFQDGPDSTVLFHGGADGYLPEVLDRRASSFAQWPGLFASRSVRSAKSHGGDVTAFRINDADMLTQSDLDSLDESDIDTALAGLVRAEPGSDEFDAIRRAVVNERGQESQEFMDAVGMDDAGEAGWYAQSLRGQLGAKLGYKAIEMDDEHGKSWYIVPGVKSIPLPNESSDTRQAPPREGLGASGADKRIAYSRKTPAEARAESAQKQADLGAQLVVSPGQSFVYVDQFTDDWRGQTRKMRERIQDKLLSVRDAQKDIEKIRGAIEDAANVYRRENLMHGRVGDQRDKLQATHVKPLIEAMAEAKVSPALMEDYLEARHAKERNEKIAATKGGMTDGASGMTTAQAEDFLQGRAAGHRSGVTLDPAMTRQVSRLARKVDAITSETRRRLLDSGQITQDAFDALESTYAAYVPLRGKDGTEGGKGRGTGKGIDVRGKPVLRAAGRGEGNRAQNILAEVIADAERSIINAEKLRVGRTLARLVLENPNPDVWAIEPVKTELKVSEGTPEEIYEAVKNLDQEEGTIIVKVKGKPYRIVIEDQRMADALKNMAVETVPEVIQYVAALNRYFSAVLTRYNPSFVGVNMTRDLLFGMTGIWAEHGTAAAAKAAASYFPAMRAAWRDIQGKPPVNAMGRYAREFAEAGGKTYFGKLENVSDMSQRIGEEFKTFRQMAMPKFLGGEMSPVRALAKVARDSKMVQAIEAVNDTVENTLRLSVYAARREAGASIEQAAEYAKNISVNFNRRGSATSWLNALYLFFNAATQGAHRTLTLLKNPKVQGVLGGLAALQATSAMFLMGLDDEDGEPLWDSISPWDKQRNLILAIPIKRENGWGATVIKIPMPYGFNLFPYMGGRSVELARDLQEKPVGRAIADYTTDAVVGVAQAMSPIPFDDGWKAALPHWVRIFTVLAENKDDLGIPVRAGDQYDSFDKPRSASGRDDTPMPFKIAATALNRLGGGDDYTPPYAKFALDWAPEDLAYLFKTFAGGLGSNVVKSGTLTEKLIAGVPVNFKDVPVLSSFVSNVDQRQATSSRYYDHKDDIEREVARQRDLAKETGEVGDNPMGIKIARNKSGSKIKRGEGYELEGANGSLFDTYKQAEKDISRIRDEMRAAFNDQSISYTERIRKIDELKSEREEVQRELNAAWREQRKKRTQ